MIAAGRGAAVRNCAMIDFAKRMLQIQFVRYFIASVGALAVDMGSFLLLLETSLQPGISAGIAYTLGIVAHWIMLSRSVFQEGAYAKGRQRTQQKAVFITTTWAGLALTSGIVGMADYLGANLIVSKGFAVVISFVLNYFIRKHFIFTAHRRAAKA